MRYFFLSSACILASFSTLSTALKAVAGQQCASACGDITRTKSSDIVCSDADISNTVTGKVLQNCLTCQQKSTANDPNTGESDLRWFIYNLRFTMSSCLWGYPNNASVLSTPCITNPACGLYQANMEYNSLLPNASTFDYCGDYDTRSQLQQPRCISCLQQLRDDYYMSNFFIALVAGCQQRPNAGSLLSIDGNLFDKTPINITAPVQTTNPVYTAQSAGGLGLGAIVGIAIGALVAILTTLGCCTIWWGKRRRRSQLQRLHARAGNSTNRQGRAQVETKWGQNAPPGGWSPDETPTTAGGYGSEDKVFSPYSSRYNSPVSARDMLNPKQIWDAHQPGVGTAQTSSGTKDEAIEMEKLRDQRIEERKIRENQMHAEFLQDAAERGFTTTPIIRIPSTSKARDRDGI